MLGLKTLSGGSIRFEGMTVGAMTAEQLRSVSPRLTAHLPGPFLLARSAHAYRARSWRRRCATIGARRRPSATSGRERVLEEVGLGGFGGARAPDVGRATAADRYRARHRARPRLVVADEPVSALDMTIQAQVLTLLQKLQSEYGFACLFITHDLSVVDSIADQMVVMSEGRIVERGPTRTVLAQAVHPYTRALVEATPRLPGRRNCRRKPRKALAFRIYSISASEKSLLFFIKAEYINSAAAGPFRRPRRRLPRLGRPVEP